MSEALKELASHGVLGVICVILMGAIVSLYRALEQERKDRTSAIEAVQNARIEDAKLREAKLIEMITAVTGAIAQSTGSQAGTKEALNELRESFEKLAEDIRRRFAR